MRNVLGIMAFVLLAGQAQSAGLAKSGFIERVMTVKNTGASSMETSKLYWEGNNLRMEQYTTAGLVVNIRKGQVLYIYSPAEKKAVKTTIPAGQGGSVQQFIEKMSSPVKGAKKVGTATVIGIKCDVFSASEKGSSAKLYISTDPRLPTLLKSQETSGALSRSVETKQLKLNYNVPDTMFSLPKGVTVKEEKFPTPPAAGKK
ncbi:MAG TPA: hypothetical protein VFI02_03835 [Armatimonadota bacterium]|nr:hypothetical protein [Armatimonadota bacterium]